MTLPPSAPALIAVATAGLLLLAGCSDDSQDAADGQPDSVAGDTTDGPPTAGSPPERNAGQAAPVDPGAAISVPLAGGSGSLRGDPAQGTATFQGGPAQGGWATVGTLGEMTDADADAAALMWFRPYVAPNRIDMELWDAWVADLHERAAEIGPPFEGSSFAGHPCYGTCHATARALHPGAAEAAGSPIRGVRIDLYHAVDGDVTHSVWLYAANITSRQAWAFEPIVLTLDDRYADDLDRTGEYVSRSLFRLAADEGHPYTDLD